MTEITAAVLVSVRADNRATLSKVARRLSQARYHQLSAAATWPGVVAIVVDPDNVLFEAAAGRHIGVVWLAQVLPFYDEACIRSLRGFEELVYQYLR